MLPRTSFLRESVGAIREKRAEGVKAAARATEMSRDSIGSASRTVRNKRLDAVRGVSNHGGVSAPADDKVSSARD
jgi:hypothetical protein